MVNDLTWLDYDLMMIGSIDDLIRLSCEIFFREHFRIFCHYANHEFKLILYKEQQEKRIKEKNCNAMQRSLWMWSFC